ncbi:cytochrome P450 [Streptomyces olivoverticillatus]|uniref:Cytochrome P450 n=1 Tax=Streptomyces olivoverticillatus TaxID=66427 RepID=A0A7W7LPI0_9ACTN|nr:cytochrome P450 [Streptomyces olivoverticillatus]MBB4893401.1 cytochrome P450 [Streptomyces olivoverticillatus]
MTQAVPATFSTVREDFFNPPAVIREFREKAPLTRMAFPGGHPGWLVTGHAAARAVLADPRFTARAERGHPPVPRAATLEEFPAPRHGSPGRTENTGRRRHRELLTAQFTPRRMRRFTEWAAKAAGKQAAAMHRAGPSADLVGDFALPYTSLALCELLGVPEADRETFQRDVHTWALPGTTRDITRAFASLGAHLHHLVLRKRAEPADDLLGGLIAAEPALSDEDLTSTAFLLLIAGHATTAHQLALGIFALLQHPRQLAAVRADRSLTDGAVEEMLRHLSVVHHGPTRAALEDAEIDGTLVRAGEIVMVSLPAANRDPDHFESPDRFDVTRDGTGHLAFGHGAHHCPGDQAARIQLRAGLTALLDRFPGLRLAVPPQEIPLHTDTQVYGAHRLPVTW